MVLRRVGTLTSVNGLDLGLPAMRPGCGTLSDEPDLFDELGAGMEVRYYVHAGLAPLQHPELIMMFDAMLVMGPEHARVFTDAGWDRHRTVDGIMENLSRPDSEPVRGAGWVNGDTGSTPTTRAVRN